MSARETLRSVLSESNVTALAWMYFGLSFVVYLASLYITAPWGKHGSVVSIFIPLQYGNPGRSAYWGPRIDPRITWVVMESPNLLSVPIYFWLGRESVVWRGPNLALLGLFVLHYVNRTLIYPFRIKPGSQTPLAVASLAFFWCLSNGIMQGRFLGDFVEYRTSWLSDPRFVAGVLLFFAGMAINIHSDEILRNLRKPGDKGYYIPKGSCFAWVTASNYFGEIVEWSGFALASWNLVGGVFALWTFCNLAPRALAHHQWYKKKFNNYPTERTAVVPYLL